MFTSAMSALEAPPPAPAPTGLQVAGSLPASSAASGTVQVLHEDARIFYHPQFLTSGAE